MQIQHPTQHSKKTIFASLPLFISLLVTTLPFSTASADTDYEVQSGDSLSKIVAKIYPEVARQSYGTIMQHTLKNNPSAFSNKNINSLRLGKTLTLTDKADIEGLKPKPPAPIPVNPEEFKKLQSQNSDLEKQLQTLKSELEKLQGASPSTETTTSAPAADAASQEKIDTLQAKVEQLLAQVKKLEVEKQELASGSSTATEQQATQLAEAQTLTEQLQTEITTLKAENTELSKVDAAALEKQVSDSQTELSQLKDQLAKLETEKQELAKADSNLQAANKQIETLQADAEQLNSLVTKYEADQQDSTQTEAESKQLEELQAEVTLLQGLATKHEADQEESDALIKQLEGKVASSSASGSGDNTTENTADSTAQIDKLQQENSLLQAEIEKARSKASQDNNTINQLKANLASATSSTPTTPAINPATNTQSQSEPSSWLKLSMLSWLLPLLAILVGLYLLSRLIKRNRDKQATSDFKTAMSTSASSNTAAAFGIDGSAPAPHSSSDSEANTTAEEDSLEAGVKIDIAKAYIDLNETDAANEMLQEAIIEGSASQKEAAESLLK